MCWRQRAASCGLKRSFAHGNALPSFAGQACASVSRNINGFVGGATPTLAQTQGRREEAERGVPELAQPRALRRPRVVSGIVELPAAPDAAADAPAAGTAVPVRTAPQLQYRHPYYRRVALTKRAAWIEAASLELVCVAFDFSELLLCILHVHALVQCSMLVAVRQA